MKKYGIIVFPAILLLALFMITGNAQAMEEGHGMKDRIHMSGLVRFGGVWETVDYADGGDDDASDFALAAVELEVGAKVSDWVSVETLILYEDEVFEEESHVEMDEAVVTIANADVCPGSVSVGKMFVPFGALLTHFPDGPHTPLIDQPLTLVFGETLEKALLVGFEREALSLSAYAFNGDVDEAGQENHVETFGLDANYTVKNEEGPNVLAGASYISNIAESEGLQEALEEHHIDEIEDYVGGFAAYLSVTYDKFFADVEYMTALDEFDADVLHEGSEAAEPSVWNVEVGYNCDFKEKNLEIALKYAGSDEAEALGYPETRYGICLNREVLEGIMASVAYVHDDYEDGDVRDGRDTLLGQIAIEF